MNHYLALAKGYVATHKKVVIGIATGIGAVLLLVVLYLAVFFSNPSRVMYAPVQACDLLTPAKAQDLLGDKVISVDTKAPAVADDISVSKCSYTNRNPVETEMRVAAIAVRAGVNDKGIARNKSDFISRTPTVYVETVEGIGDRAYFNQKLGQLNVLRGREWMILSFGVGERPQENTVEHAVELAKKVLDKK